MPITYRQGGVDIDAGEELVRRIGPLAKATRTAGTAAVVGDIGGFAGMCRLPAGMKEPLLVSGTDGVGTKLKVAFATGVHDTVGIDLVAMCVNDILCTGAEPLFFLDYFASGKLDVDVGEAVVRGIAEGCKLAGCALVGGETAELPGMYADGEYDLAGFAVGVVERAAVLSPGNVRAGDAVIALASSGLHSNGYSLARRVFEARGVGYGDRVEALASMGANLGEALLTPTRIYVKAVRALQQACGDALHGLAHITGGGLVDNAPRCLPDGLGMRLDRWERPAIFRVLGESVEEPELRRAFNLGVGMTAVVAADSAGKAIDAAVAAGEKAWRLGEVIAVGDAGERVVMDG
jgi:phosphoribosylformylglycinamidine cyclo-ligase